MTVVELLRIAQHGRIQGTKTRLFVEINGEFTVLGRKDSRIGSTYTVELYRGRDETRAVLAYVTNEGEDL